MTTQSSKYPSEKIQGILGAKEGAPKPALEDQQILPENNIQDAAIKINWRDPRLSAGGRGYFRDNTHQSSLGARTKLRDNSPELPGFI